MQQANILTNDEIEQLITTTASRVASTVKPIHFPLIMNKRQLSEYLGKSISTVDGYMREGLPFKKEGKDHPEFYKPHVDAWLAERFATVEMEAIQ